MPLPGGIVVRRKNIRQLSITGGSTPKPLPKHLQVLVDMLPLNTPVHRSVIAKQYGKSGERSNYARRIRKIVAEYGWDIERRRESNGANDDFYIRRSDGPVRKQHIRREVAPSQRREVYERDGWICRMCGTGVSEAQKETRAQCDHRVPAERGGLPENENLQTLCLRCNLKKRQSCAYCKLPDCLSCPYAFPEKFEQALVLALDAASATRLRKRCQESGEPPAVIIARLLGAD